jgi:hypothetical protein
VELLPGDVKYDKNMSNVGSETFGSESSFIVVVKPREVSLKVLSSLDLATASPAQSRILESGRLEGTMRRTRCFIEWAYDMVRRQNDLTRLANPA